jgi:hypothetical protein
MDNNNIVLVMEAIGEKIANLKSALNYEEIRNTMLAEENVKLKEENALIKRQYDEVMDKLNEYCGGGLK